MDNLCVHGDMSLRQWIEMAATLGVDGLEFYAGFLGLQRPRQWDESRRTAQDHGLQIPMLCCSPDFTHPDPVFRKREIEAQKRRIDMAVSLGAAFCRVLAGHAGPS